MHRLTRRLLPTVFAIAMTVGALGAFSPLQVEASGPVVTTRNPNLNREVFGFVQAGNLTDPNVGWQTYNLSLLSTIAYFGLHVCANQSQSNCSGVATGGFANDSALSTWNSPALGQMVQAAHAAHVRVVLTVVYQATDSTMCAALDSAATTVSQTVQQVEQKGVDGVNIDYEGTSESCNNGATTTQNLMSSFVAQMRSALPSPWYLTVDTYGASAAYAGGDGFFNIPALAPNVDAFFVMAYELDNSNWSSPPLNCSSYCMSPTSPISTYKWSDQSIAQQYSSLAGASKTILGLPYYGWAACTTSLGENATPLSGSPANWNAATQYSIQGLSFIHFQTDSHDGVDQWASYQSSNSGQANYDPYDPCPTTYGGDRELYIDSPSSLATKYQVVLNDGLSGAGIWSLDYGGGIAALWGAIADKFSKSPGLPTAVHACPGDGFAVVNWTAAPSGAAPITSSTVTATPGGASATVGSATQAVVTGLSDGTPYSLSVQSTNSYGSGPPGFSNQVTPASSSGVWPGQYHSVTPSRLLDTRNGTGVGQVAPGAIQELSVAGAGGVPSGAGAVVLNVTATDVSQPGYLTAFASGTCQPLTSSLNFAPGGTVASLVMVPIGPDGKVSLYNGSSGSIDIVADVFGYYSTSSASSGTSGYLVVPPTAPVRLLDTRTSQQPLGPGSVYRLPITTAAGGSLPDGVSAVVVNLTAVGPTAAGWLSMYPDGSSWPGTSNVNFAAGQTVPNRVVVPVGSDGMVDIRNAGGYTQVLVDLSGYFTGGGLTSSHAYTATVPVRILDTRCGTGGYSSPVGGGQTISLSIAGQPGLPASAGSISAVVLNLTATNTTQPTFVTAYPDGMARPLTSDLNPPPGGTEPNLVVVAVGPDGKIDLYNNSGSVNLIADLVGWFN